MEKVKIPRQKAQGKGLQGKRKITKNDIRKRAYEIYLGRSPDEAYPEDDWFMAEEELYSAPGY